MLLLDMFSLLLNLVVQGRRMRQGRFDHLLQGKHLEDLYRRYQVPIHEADTHSALNSELRDPGRVSASFPVTDPLHTCTDWPICI